MHMKSRPELGLGSVASLYYDGYAAGANEPIGMSIDGPYPGGSRAYQAEKDAIQAAIEGGADRIAIGNGFAFVVDRGHKDDYIPVDEFTDYHSRGEVPVAAPGHKHFGHDIDHAPDYKDLYRRRGFAVVVRAAATHARGDGALCAEFAGAIDSFSNERKALIRGGATRDETGPRSARFHLGRLIALAHPEGGAQVSPGGSLHKALHNQVGLGYFLDFDAPLPEETYYASGYGLRDSMF
jgi:hypothetical protein